MSEQIPAPLVLPHINLKDVPAVLLDIDRLLESDFWLSTNGEECRAGMCLWLKSFRQLPAGSLPDDDTSLSRLCQLAPAHWADVREKALHGWIKCDDGRLYHRVIAEKVLLMHTYRLVQRLRGAKGMEVRYNIERDAGNDSVTLMHEIHACLELLEALSAAEAKKFREKYARTLTSSALQTSGRRSTVKAPPQRDLLGESPVAAGNPEAVVASPKPAPARKQRPAKATGTTYSSAFVEFWNAYPRKDKKQEAAAAWMKQALDDELPNILSDIRKRKSSPEWLKSDGQFIPQPPSYLNKRRWDNAIDPSKIVDQPKAASAPQAVSLLPDQSPSTTSPLWWADAGFTSATEAEGDGCREGKHHYFRNGVRIKDVYGNPRAKPEIFDSLCHRMRRWMTNFTNPAFFPERDHALQTMRSMPKIDFWGMLQGKTPEKDRNALRELLMALPEESATSQALRA